MAPTDPEADPMAPTDPEADPMAPTDPEADPMAPTDPEADPMAPTDPEADPMAPHPRNENAMGLLVGFGGHETLIFICKGYHHQQQGAQPDIMVCITARLVHHASLNICVRRSYTDVMFDEPGHSRLLGDFVKRCFAPLFTKELFPTINQQLP